MEVKDLRLYHFHKKGVYDSVWQEGNELKVDENFHSHYCYQLKDFSAAANVNIYGVSKKLDMGYFLDHYLDEEYFKPENMEEIKKVLKKASSIIKEEIILNRETALENYRKDHYPELPSRFHSIWVTDFRGRYHWEERLAYSRKDLELFVVLLNGNLFCSSDAFIPSNELSVEEMYQASEAYWNPTFHTSYEKNRLECLFQGDVKILKKI